MTETQRNDSLCWIHIKDVFTFLYLGANPHEQKVGQNIRLDLSIQIPYRMTEDQLSKTIDYGTLIKRIQNYIENLESINLLEFLAEQVLNLIEIEYPAIRGVRLVLHKAFVPISNFTGTVAIEVARTFAN